ncbi:uncharacterized protein [Epargyreus clarus]
MAKENEREAWTKVIDLFKDLPYLWDKKQKDYFNRDMRQEAFKMLVQIFNEEIGRDTSLADFKKKLENMRTTYGRELKKVNASKQTGSGSNDIYVPALWYYPLFQFLEGTTEPCRPGTDTLDEASETESKGNVTSPDISASTSSTQIINTEIYDKEGPADSGKSSQPRKQKMSIQSKQEKLLDAAQTLMTRQDDDWEIIGKSIGVQLKNLSTHQQVIAQKIINDSLFYGKLGKLTDESSITLSPQHTVLHPRIPHRYYHYSSGSSVTNSSPQPCQQYLAQPSPQPSPQYAIHPSPQSSTQFIIPQSPQTPPQHTVQPSPQPPQHHMMSQFPQASPEYNSTVQPFLQSIPQYTFEQPSSEYVNPTNATHSSSTDIDLTTEFPNCTSDTTVQRGTGSDMKDFLIFNKK